MEQYQGAEAFLEVLNSNGIERVFFNPGGDLAPIQAAVLRYRVLGKKAPRLVLCLHESVALSAAHAHYMVTGKPQVVMVHSELGSQQLGGALHNAQWGRVPVVIFAGVAAASHRLNWKNEAYDQGEMVRNSVKWDHEIAPGEDIHDALQKAFDIACSDPCGPVYLSYGRDVLGGMTIRRELETREHTTPTLPAPPLDVIDRIASALVEAAHPLILVGYSGRHRETLPQLVELAESLSAEVISGLTRVNFPTTHPLCAGIEQMGSAGKPNSPLAEADAVLVLDYDAPYVPASGMPNSETKVFHIDVDALTQGRPLWNREADVFLKADSRQAISELIKAIRDKMTPEQKSQLQERFARLAARHEEERNERHDKAKYLSEQKPISAEWVCRCIADFIDDDTVVVNQLISQSRAFADQFDRTEPGTLLSCAGGSIQWALGAGLGAKVAVSDKTVVSLMTDGGFVWGCPISTLWTARSYDAPFLSVIFNNQSYGAIRRLVQNMTESDLSGDAGFYAGVDISPPPDYALVAASCGAYGRMVEEPSEVLPALREALSEVRGGRAAVLDIRLAKG